MRIDYASKGLWWNFSDGEGPSWHLRMEYVQWAEYLNAEAKELPTALCRFARRELLDQKFSKKNAYFADRIGRLRM